MRRQHTVYPLLPRDERKEVESKDQLPACSVWCLNLFRALVSEIITPFESGKQLVLQGTCSMLHQDPVCFIMCICSLKMHGRRTHANYSKRGKIWGYNYSLQKGSWFSV